MGKTLDTSDQQEKTLADVFRGHVRCADGRGSSAGCVLLLLPPPRLSFRETGGINTDGNSDDSFLTVLDRAALTVVLTAAEHGQRRTAL